MSLFKKARREKALLLVILTSVALLAIIEGDVVVCALRGSDPARLQELKVREDRLLSAAKKPPKTSPTEFSINGVALGMSRDEVEARYGEGRKLESRVVYGNSWEAQYNGNLYYWLDVTYNEHGLVSTVSGARLHRDGKPIVPSKDEPELVGLGKPTRVLLAVSIDSGSSTILDYNETLGLSAEVVSMENVAKVHYTLTPARPCETRFISKCSFFLSFGTPRYRRG